MKNEIDRAVDELEIQTKYKIERTTDRRYRIQSFLIVLANDWAVIVDGTRYNINRTLLKNDIKKKLVVAIEEQKKKNREQEFNFRQKKLL